MQHHVGVEQQHMCAVDLAVAAPRARDAAARTERTARHAARHVVAYVALAHDGEDAPARRLAPVCRLRQRRRGVQRTLLD
jgi:hypothetical protein